MAKRYVRINWQNKPSTATPWSAGNLNIMDKGINDLDDAIELKIDKANIVQNAISTNPDTVASGPALKAVQDQVTAQTNNLVAKSMFVEKTSANTLATLPCPAYESRRYYYLAGLPTDFPIAKISSASYFYVEIISVGIKVARITAILESGNIEHVDGYFIGENYMWSAKY